MTNKYLKTRRRELAAGLKQIRARQYEEGQEIELTRQQRNEEARELRKRKINQRRIRKIEARSRIAALQAQ